MRILLLELLRVQVKIMDRGSWGGAIRMPKSDSNSKPLKIMYVRHIFTFSVTF